jgi:hypothetical protein
LAELAFRDTALIPPGHEDEIRRVVRYHIFGQEYGWTPDEVDRLPAKVASSLLVLFHISAARRHSAQQELENKMVRK